MPAMKKLAAQINNLIGVFMRDKVGSLWADCQRAEVIFARGKFAFARTYVIFSAITEPAEL
jgi:hypothetical protein